MVQVCFEWPEQAIGKARVDKVLQETPKQSTRGQADINDMVISQCLRGNAEVTYNPTIA
jgi:hypothetical protein